MLADEEMNGGGGEPITFIDYELLIGLGAVLGALWLGTMLVIRHAFPTYGWLSAETLTFFTTLFDFVSDVVFVALLFRTSFTDLRLIALACLLATAAADALIIAYVAHREKEGNPNFAKWLEGHWVVAAVIYLCSLGNTESFTLLSLGYTVPSRWTSNVDPNRNVIPPQYADTSENRLSTISKIIVPWLTAPVSPPSIQILRRTAWLSFALDDIALFAIQLVRTSVPL